MASKIMIINHGGAFMTDALETSLHKCGIVTVSVEPVIEKIEHEKDDSDMIILFAGDYVFDMTDVLVYLKDLCTGDEKALCVIGYSKEIAAIEETVPKSVVTHEFLRPFEMKTLTEQLQKIVAAEEERRKGKHILLVDDDLTFLKMMQAWLSMKYRITAVRSGMQAITYIANHTPDLILLDYDMPVIQGPQILEMIKSEAGSSRIPVIFLTGKSDKESVMNVMKLHPDGYLLKTMTKEQIAEAISDFFTTKKWKNAN
ncbi:MAG: response regulator [Ruminiclostridium sp.]|nr:response regulator [Ruminiclostridium sp.]